MTKDDLALALQWLHAQWPHSQPWEPDTIETTWQLIAHHQAEHLWTALHQIHQRGDTWMPPPPTIIHQLREVARHAHQQTPALPQPGEPVTFKQFLERRGKTTFAELLADADQMAEIEANVTRWAEEEEEEAGQR